MVRLLFLLCLFATGFAESRKVVVVGGGIAGLTTAYRLQKEGMDVELYEARSRVGGRILTIIVNGNIAELGAHNISDGGDACHLYGLIKELKLDTTTGTVNLKNCYFDGQKLIPATELLADKKFDPEILKQTLEDLSHTCHSLKEILDKVIDPKDPLNKIISVRIAAYEGATVDKLSSFYVETLYYMLTGGISSVHQEKGDAAACVELITVKGGNTTLPETLAKQIKVHLNMPLTKVAKNGDNCFVLTFQNGKEVTADIVVLAIPASIYEDIDFAKDVIPENRLKAIRSIPYGTNAKILVPFSHSPKDNRGMINDCMISYFDPDKTTLTVYCTGKSSFFSKETVLDTYKYARPMMELGFSDDCPSFLAPKYAEDKSFATYEGPVGYSWPNDPYVKGSYSYIAPGFETLLTTTVEAKGEKYKALFAPINNLYFVGEHTSILFDVCGTMEAGCESGERIARAILRQ